MLLWGVQDVILRVVYKSAKALVNEGVLWHIGDVVPLWVVVEEGRFITSPQVAEVTHVSELINMSAMEGNFEVISLHFHEKDQQSILSIRPKYTSP